MRAALLTAAARLMSAEDDLFRKSTSDRGNRLWKTHRTLLLFTCLS